MKADAVKAVSGLTDPQLAARLSAYLGCDIDNWELAVRESAYSILAAILGAVHNRSARARLSDVLLSDSNDHYLAEDAAAFLGAGAATRMTEHTGLKLGARALGGGVLEAVASALTPGRMSAQVRLTLAGLTCAILFASLKSRILLDRPSWDGFVLVLREQWSLLGTVARDELVVPAGHPDVATLDAVIQRGLGDARLGASRFARIAEVARVSTRAIERKSAKTKAVRKGWGRRPVRGPLLGALLASMCVFVLVGLKNRDQYTSSVIEPIPAGLVPAGLRDGTKPTANTTNAVGVATAMVPPGVVFPVAVTAASDAVVGPGASDVEGVAAGAARSVELAVLNASTAAAQPQAAPDVAMAASEPEFAPRMNGARLLAARVPGGGLRVVATVQNKDEQAKLVSAFRQYALTGRDQIEVSVDAKAGSGSWIRVIDRLLPLVVKSGVDITASGNIVEFGGIGLSAALRQQTEARVGGAVKVVNFDASRAAAAAARRQLEKLQSWRRTADCGALASLLARVHVAWQPHGDRLLPASVPLVAGFAQALRICLDRERGSNWYVEAFSDNTLGRQEAVSISQRRADNLRQMLVEAGVAADRVSAHGFGSDNPLTSNLTARGRFMNARASFVRFVERDAKTARKSP